jgi:YD repeat-containing protein
MALNREDVAMLNQSLQAIGQSALQRRQMAAEREMEMQRLALESQLRDIQEARYDQNTAYQNRLMDRQADTNDLLNQRNQLIAQSSEDRNRILAQGKQAAQDLADAKEGLNQFSQTLRANRMANARNPAQGLTQDQAAGMFQQSMAQLPDAIRQKMSQDPMYSALATGKVDFSTIPQFDAKGNPTHSSLAGSQTIYHRDAQGNLLSIETHRNGDNSDDNGDEASPAGPRPAAAPVTSGQNGSGNPGTPAPALPASVPDTRDFWDRLLNKGQVPVPSPTNAVPSVPAGTLSAAPAVQSSSAIPFIHTQDDYDTLPIGSPYRDSSGKLAVKSAPPQPIPTGGGLPVQVPDATNE